MNTLTTYEYLCENGHGVRAPRPVHKCPVASCGTSVLARVGRGSKSTPTKETE